MIAMYVWYVTEWKCNELIEGDVLIMNPKHENWHLLLFIFFPQF